MNLENEIEIDEDLVDIKNDSWFRELMPRYDYYNSGPYVDYSNEWFLNGNKYRGGVVFDVANNNACSCAIGYIDSTIDTAEFKRNLTIQNNLRGWFDPCTDEMQDFECYYYLRANDNFDLSIENVAKDGCSYCYGVGQELWPLSEDQLIDTLTRSMGDSEDCTPKQGYHKSIQNEIYRCEEGDHSNGIMAFTEANGQTDYQCGLYYSPNYIEVVGDNDPIILVSFFDYVYKFVFISS